MKYLMKLQPLELEPLLQLIDVSAPLWDSQTKVWGSGHNSSLSALICLAPFGSRGFSPPAPWLQFGDIESAAFCEPFARLRDLYLRSDQYIEKWSKVTSRLGCSNDRRTLDDVYQNTTHIRGWECGYRKRPIEFSRNLAGLDSLNIAPSETLLMLEAESFPAAIEAAAYVVFWQILEGGIELYSCDHCKAMFLVSPRERFCTAAHGKEFYSARRKRNLLHARNCVRITLFIDALINWARNPVSPWNNAVVWDKWRAHENGLDLSEYHSCGLEPKKAPRNDRFMQLCQDAAEESGCVREKRNKLLEVCTSAEASAEERRRVSVLLERLYTLLRQRVQFSWDLDPEQRTLGKSA